MKTLRTTTRIIAAAALFALAYSTAQTPFATAQSEPNIEPSAPPGQSSSPSTQNSSNASQSTVNNAVAVIVPIRGEINDITLRFLERAFADAAAQKAQWVVLEMNTPGGSVGSTLEITKLIKKTGQIETIAWVRPWAISAGAMISVACSQIIIAPQNTIGDCAPIMVGAAGMEELGGTEREKIETVIRAEFRDSAQRNGYPLALCNAMVSLSPPIYQVIHKQTGEKQYVLEAELSRFNLTLDDLGKRPSVTNDATNGNTDENEDQSDNGWWLAKKVLDKDQLLTMTNEEALDYGFARAKVANEKQLADYLKISEENVSRMEPTWSEELAAWLGSSTVRSILLMVVLIAGYMEMQTPGLGIPGAVAAVALIVMLGAPYLTGLANIGEILLIIVGVILLFVEAFVLPGFGVTGIAGLIFIFLGMLMTFVGDGVAPGWTLPDTPYAWSQLESGFIAMFVSLTVSIVAIFFLSKYFGSIPVLNRLILHGIAGGPDVSTETTDSGQPETEPTPDLNVGREGLVVMTLRPVGRMEVDGRLYDVVSEGAWIANGRRVRVTSISGNRIFVEEVAE